MAFSGVTKLTEEQELYLSRDHPNENISPNSQEDRKKKAMEESLLYAALKSSPQTRLLSKFIFHFNNFTLQPKPKTPFWCKLARLFKITTEFDKFERIREVVLGLQDDIGQIKEHRYEIAKLALKKARLENKIAQSKNNEAYQNFLGSTGEDYATFKKTAQQTFERCKDKLTALNTVQPFDVNHLLNVCLLSPPTPIDDRQQPGKLSTYFSSFSSLLLGKKT